MVGNEFERLAASKIDNESDDGVRAEWRGLNAS
jgi:hypothetical protein